MGVIERALRFTSVVCSLLVIVGWGWFAISETNAASEQSQAEIASQTASRTASPDPDQEHDREKANSKVHEYVDDANDVLLRPSRRSPKTVQASGCGERFRRCWGLVYGFGIGITREAAGRW